MSRHGGKNNFDTSDLESPEIDTLDGVLDVAGEVLRDYAGIPGTTRIERMSRWLALNLGGPPYDSLRVGGLERCKLDHGQLEVIRAGEKFGITQGGLTIIVGEAAHEARVLAVALLRAAEHSEETD